MEVLKQPMHWSIAGILIGLTVPALMLAGNKKFGVSSTLKHLCAMCVPSVSYFNYDLKAFRWLLVLMGGIIIGAFVAGVVLPNPQAMSLSESTQTYLSQYGISVGEGLQPMSIFGVKGIGIKQIVVLLFGGILVGFGTRYAEGCTSGHSIYGLATLQWPSLVATICFMVGGIFSAWFIVPSLLTWLNQ